MLLNRITADTTRSTCFGDLEQVLYNWSTSERLEQFSLSTAYDIQVITMDIYLSTYGIGDTKNEFGIIMELSFHFR